MENKPTNIKNLIIKAKRGEQLTPEEMQTVAQFLAKKRFEKEQQAKNKADFNHKKIENKNSKPQEVANRDVKQPSFHEQVAKAEAEAAKKDKSLKKRAKEEKKLLKKDKKARARNKDRALKSLDKNSFKENLQHPLDFIKRCFTAPNPYYNEGAGEFVYVAGKKVKNRMRTFSAKRSAKSVIIIMLSLFILIFAYTLSVIAFSPKIDPTKIYDQISTDSVIYDDQGERVDSASTGQNRTIIKYKDLPKQTVASFVALEDKTFWKHHGFNWNRMAGAVLTSFRSGGISGTSTITQQLARNVYLPNIKSQRSIKRKILEMYYAARIEHALSKEEIFAAYVNSIYFGYGNYGIENASKMYFSKSVKDLTVEESAALASMPQSPDTYSLIQNADSPLASRETSTPIKLDGNAYIINDISRPRRHIVYKLLMDQGYINESTYQKYKDDNLEDFIKPDISANGSATDTSYFTDYLLTQVIAGLQKKYNMSYDRAKQMVYNGGLKIYSTMNTKAQQAVEDGFKDGSYFPSLSGLKKDGSGNIVKSDGSVSLYEYSNMFNDNNFVLRDDEYKANKDGSITIYKNKRLNIYKTSTAEGTDYSLEFKPSYQIDNGSFYIIPGGYVNIPASSKSMDKDGNLVISGKFIQNKSSQITKVDGKPAFTEKLYTLQDRVIQPQGAMVITEVGTGEVKAIVGGRGVTGKQLFNRAVNNRQPGSSIKPLAIYSAALQRSYEYAENGEKFHLVDPGNDKQGTSKYGDYLTAASTIIDEPIKFNGKFWPKNSNNRYSGAMSMRKGMQTSTNVVAVKLFEQLGADYSYDMVKKYGISTLQDSANGDKNAAALALGGLSKGVSPYEMSEAYATFPNGGERVENRVFTKVVDKDGKIILSTEKEKHKVLDEGVSYIMVSMLKSVVSGGTGRNAAIPGVEVGGKTGTTSDNYDIWFDGITPKYAASLWIGTDVNIPLTAQSEAAARLWSRIMRNVPNINRGSYKKAPSNIVKKNGEFFTKGTENGLSSHSEESSYTTEEIENEPTENGYTTEYIVDQNNGNQNAQNNNANNNNQGQGHKDNVLDQNNNVQNP